MRLLIVVAIGFLQLLIYGGVARPAQAQPDYNIDKLWPGTWIYPPGQPGRAFRAGDDVKLAKAAAEQKKPTPAVIYLHGCDGYERTFYEAAYARALSKAGFAVFVPDSYARGPRRKNVCGDVRIDTVELRRAEVRATLSKIKQLPWVDQSNLFLAGHSEGGITAAMYRGAEFRAYYIAGWTCTSKAPEFDRIHASRDRPVLAVVGSKDEYHVGTFREHDHCGMRMKDRPGSRSIVLEGWDHSVSTHRDTVPMVVKFFTENLAR